MGGRICAIGKLEKTNRSSCVSVVHVHIQREWQGIDVKEMIRGS